MYTCRSLVYPCLLTGNPKKAWKTVNDILGRKQRADDVREIKINDHSVTSPEEIAEKSNDYFTSIDPSLAENIDNSECNYSQFVNRVDGIFHFQPVSSSINYLILCLSARLLGSIKYQPKF